MKVSEITCSGLVCGVCGKEVVEERPGEKRGKEAVLLAVALVLAGTAAASLWILGSRYGIPLPLETWDNPLNMLGYFVGLAG